MFHRRIHMYDLLDKTWNTLCVIAPPALYSSCTLASKHMCICVCACVYGVVYRVGESTIDAGDTSDRSLRAIPPGR